MIKNQKICKIVEEFSLYLLENNIKDLTMDISNCDDQVIINFSFSGYIKDIKDYVLLHIKGQRDPQIEEYGWELMGEGAYDDDLGIINALIDEINYLEQNNKTIVRMVRYES